MVILQFPLAENCLEINHLAPVHGLIRRSAQCEKSSCFSLPPCGEEHCERMMMMSHCAKPLPILSGRLGCMTAFDLNKNYLEGVTALCSCARRPMVLANGDEVYNARRFAAVRPTKTDKMPARIRRPCHRSANAHFGHR